MQKIILTFLFIIALSSSFSQFLNTADKTWRTYRKQLMFGGGATQFSGDLGGGNGSGKKFGMGDMDFEATGYNVNFGYRYQFHPLVATTTKIHLGSYHASDYFTNNFKRAKRKIDIKGTVIDISQNIEFVFYSKNKSKTRGEKKKLSRFHAFVSSGIGFTYFVSRGGPNTKFEGTPLRQLSTEGQGQYNGTKEYNPYTLSIPIGFGIQKSFSRRRSIRLEFSYMKTFTDYMDDTSGKYFSYAANDITCSWDQMYYSNPSEDWTTFKNGDSRGGKGKDCYFFASFTFVKAMGMRNKQLKKSAKI